MAAASAPGRARWRIRLAQGDPACAYRCRSPGSASAIPAASPAGRELLLDGFAAADAAPALARSRLRLEEIAHEGLRGRFILGALDDKLQRAFGERNLPGKTHQLLVPDAASYAGGLQKVLEVVHLNQIERRIDCLQSRRSGRRLRTAPLSLQKAPRSSRRR